MAHLDSLASSKFAQLVQYPAFFSLLCLVPAHMCVNHPRGKFERCCVSGQSRFIHCLSSESQKHWCVNKGGGERKV